MQTAHKGNSSKKDTEATIAKNTTRKRQQAAQQGNSSKKAHQGNSSENTQQGNSRNKKILRQLQRKHTHTMTTAAKIIPKQQQKKHTKVGFVLETYWGALGPLVSQDLFLDAVAFSWAIWIRWEEGGFTMHSALFLCLQNFSNLFTMVRVLGVDLESELGTPLGALGKFWGVLRSCGPRVRPLLTRPIDCLPIRFLQRSGGINNFF